MLAAVAGACEQPVGTKAVAPCEGELDAQENRRMLPACPPLVEESVLAEVQGATPPRVPLRRLRRVGDSAAARGTSADAAAANEPQTQPADTWPGCETLGQQTVELPRAGIQPAAAPCAREPDGGEGAAQSAHPGTQGSDGDAEHGDADDAASAEALPAKPRRRLRRKGSLPVAGAPLADAVPSDGDTDALADVLGSMTLAPQPMSAPPPPAAVEACPTPPAAAAVPSPVPTQHRAEEPSRMQAAAQSDSDDDDDEGEGAAHEGEPSACIELGSAPHDAPVGPPLEYEHAASGARFALSAPLSSRLFPHQRDGVAWLWDRHVKGCGGILGDDMGLGKTFQVAAFLAGAMQGGSVRCALVVAPTTLLAQWATELRACGLGGRVHTFGGSARAGALREVTRRGGVLLTSYGMVLHNSTDLGAPKDGDGSGDSGDESPAGVRWDWLVADEGHKLKNAKMKLVACMRQLPASRRLILTGTPVQNNLGELWALADFATPGLLGDARSFREQFEKPIARGTSRDASARERQVGVATSEALRLKLAPALLRREKRIVFGSAGQASAGDAAAAVAGPHKEEDSVAAGARDAAPKAASGAPLGTKVDLIVWLKLSPPQRRLYAAFLGSASVAAALNKTNSALAAITVLKKICDHPGLLSERAAAEIARGQCSDENAAPAEGDEEDGAPGAGLDPEASCKTTFVLHFVATAAAQGHRTLIFSQSRVMLDGLQAALGGAGHRLCRIDGGVPTGERARLVAQFQADATIPVFLLSSAVGGLGLTLTGADRVIIVDPSWNPAADAQSVDRAYRMGQTRDVAVYRLITCGTVEEKIYRKQVFKAGLSIAGTSGGDVARYFTSGELRDLFACDPAGLETPATAQVLLARHGAPHGRAPPSIADEVTATVQPFPAVAAVTDHSALFSAPDDTAAGPGELNPPMSSASAAASAPAGLGQGAGQPAKFLGAAAPWRGGSLSGGVIAASLAKFPAQVAAKSAAAEPPSAAALAAEAAARKAVRVGDMQQQLQRYAKLLMDPATARLPDGGAKFRAKVEALEAELAQLTGAGVGEDGAGATAVEGASSAGGSSAALEVEDPLALALSSLSM